MNDHDHSSLISLLDLEFEVLSGVSTSSLDVCLWVATNKIN